MHELLWHCGYYYAVAIAIIMDITQWHVYLMIGEVCTCAILRYNNFTRCQGALAVKVMLYYVCLHIMAMIFFTFAPKESIGNTET